MTMTLTQSFDAAATAFAQKSNDAIQKISEFAQFTDLKPAPANQSKAPCVKSCMRDPSLAQSPQKKKVSFPHNSAIIAGGVESKLPANPRGKGIADGVKQELWLSPRDLHTIRQRTQLEAKALSVGDKTVEARGIERRIDRNRLYAKKHAIESTLSTFKQLRSQGILKKRPLANDEMHQVGEKVLGLTADKHSLPFRKMAYMAAKEDVKAAGHQPHELPTVGSDEIASCQSMLLEPCQS